MPRTRVDYIRDQWLAMRDWVNMELDALSDEELHEAIVPGRNHGIWILGHLVASDDSLAQYLGKGELLFPERQIFEQSSVVRPVEECPEASVLRAEWRAVCDRNQKIYAELQDAELDEDHAMISGDPSSDFFRTKERVAMYWMLHQIHHAGQLALLLGKFGRRVL